MCYPEALKLGIKGPLRQGFKGSTRTATVQVQWFTWSLSRSVSPGQGPLPLGGNIKICRSCPKLIPSMPEPRCLTCRGVFDKKRAGYNEPWYRALKPTGDCFWGCGRTATERDHYTPLAEGGEHAPGNIVWACKACNSNRRKYGRGDPRP